MIILFPTLAVAFAAYCVWLTVRVVNRRERWAKWTAVSAIGLPVLYAASFGPACWLCCSGYVNSKAIVRAYDPVFRLYHTDQKMIRHAIIWYSDPLGREAPFDAPTMIGLDAMGLVYELDSISDLRSEVSHLVD